jgi:hypothetical protein
MYLYNNIFNILWVHFYNFEMNIMSIKYQNKNKNVTIIFIIQRDLNDLKMTYFKYTLT